MESLLDLICQKIQDSPQRRLTFAEYMDFVLYHPQYGYYATNFANIGKSGDFFTSPHLGADFGEMLAEQFVQMWEILQKPNPFTLVEMGAGQGIIAADILAYLQRSEQIPDRANFWDCLDYVIIEKSAALQIEQKQRLSPWNLHKPVVRWCDWQEINPHSVIGCFFSNELVDAMPVHQFMIKNHQIQEIYVTTKTQLKDNGETSLKFIEVTGEPSTTKLTEYFQLVEIQLPSPAYPDGYRSEVNLAALDWISTVAAKLKRGYLLTIDYGYPSHRYYNPRRQEGTLQCYYRHRHHNNPYLYVGQQDLTAHVDFTALEKQGELCGLNTVGLTQQGLFLMALGLGERIAALSHPNPNEALEIQKVLQRRDALHQLINPMGLGGFGVLIQSKGLNEAEQSQPLQGLKQE